MVEAPDGGEIWEVVADRWHVGLVDLVGGAGLLGQVEGRAAAGVSAWIGAQTQQGDQNRRRSSLRERVVSQVSPNPDR
jgi:hypothetical protein